MKLTLKLRFHTEFGQSLLVSGNHPLLGDGKPDQAVPLEYLNEEFWQVTLSFPADTAIPKSGIVYNYLLRQPDGSTVADWGTDRVLTPSLLKPDEVTIVDSWNAAGFPENAFYTEPFQEVLLRANQTTHETPAPKQFTHTFKVKAPLLARNQSLCLLGNANTLGRWATLDPVVLNRIPGEDFLSVSLDLTSESFPFEYKYGVYDLDRSFLLDYEGGDNRTLADFPGANGQVIVNDGFARLPADTWRGAGVAIPVFSLRSDASFGVGEFTDLKPLANWCQQVGLKVIQILPVNDTTSTHTWMDSYPYSAISAFALNPIYLNLAAVATGANKTKLKKLEAGRQRLNALPEVDYAAVMKAKREFLREIFPSQKLKTFQSKGYRGFFSENQHWLAPFAVFCHLRDQYGTADAHQWPAHRQCTPELVAAMTTADAPEFDAVAFHFFVQYHLHLQLQDAAQHAHKRGIILKGDIAIGVSRNGSDTWQSPELYDLSVQAGAPPDPFSDKGQNWGFPTYNWPRMMSDDFAWWKQRFGQMGHYFDAFRVDHILGFFRIWSIPTHAVKGLLGYFAPAIPVRLEEFAERGIAFERARYLEPFITDAVLVEIFGADADVVKQAFLQPATAGQYKLRPEFTTQQQVEKHFNERATTTPGANAVGQAFQPAGSPAFPVRCAERATGKSPAPADKNVCPTTEAEADQRLKPGLFELISNVLFIEAEDAKGRHLHCRFFMEKTASFRALDDRTQGQLRDLYVDYFFRRQDDFWMKLALQKLPALKRVTNMLICGEDLGLVPACVPDVMKGLGLLSLEIQRMPKNPGQTFSRPSDAPYLSVVTPATHDMSTIRGWWTEDTQLTQRFYNEELGQSGPAPADCSGALNKAVVQQHLASPAMWSIFQLQDLLGMDESLRHRDPHAERINVPANPKHYWRYRMHLTLGQLNASDGFNQTLRGLIQQCGR